MNKQPQIPDVQTMDALSRAVEQQWIVAGLSPVAIPNEVLQRAIQALKKAKPAPKGIAKAAEALKRSQLPLTGENAAPKRDARTRAAAVKIYRAEYRRVLQRKGSGKAKLPENSRQTLESAWEKTQTQLFRKFGIKAPDLWKYEIFPSIEK